MEPQDANVLVVNWVHPNFGAFLGAIFFFAETYQVTYQIKACRVYFKKIYRKLTYEPLILKWNADRWVLIQIFIFEQKALFSEF